MVFWSWRYMDHVGNHNCKGERPGLPPFKWWFFGALFLEEHLPWERAWDVVRHMYPLRISALDLARWRIVHTAEQLFDCRYQFAEMDHVLRHIPMSPTIFSYIHVLITWGENVQHWLLLFTKSGHIVHGNHVIFSRSRLLFFERFNYFTTGLELLLSPTNWAYSRSRRNTSSMYCSCRILDLQ